MAGEVSQGMLFDIVYEDKIKPCLAIPENVMPNGFRAGSFYIQLMRFIL